MKLSQNIFIVVMMALVAAMVIGMAITARPPRSVSHAKSVPGAEAAGEQLIDQGPLNTARALAALASTPEERDLAKNALRLSDHEIDIAFTAALSAASHEPGAKANPHIQARIDRAQAQIDALKARVQSLTTQAAHAQPSQQTRLQGQLALAEAQLDLAQNELVDAQDDMARQGGGVYARLQRQWAEHQATEHSNGKTRISSAAGSAQAATPTRSLISRGKYWASLRSKRSELGQAQRAVVVKINALTGRHNAIQAHVQAAQQTKTTAELPLATHAKTPGASNPVNSQRTATSLTELHELSRDEASLTALDHRIQDLRDLSKVYATWTSLVTTRQRTAMHLLLRSAFWIFLVLLIVSVTGRLINHLFDRIRLERKQKMTLRGVVHFTVQMIGALVILIVIFGSPSHMSTVLGLLGAGLAVALKSFVVAFFGWFVLMGRNGIQVGDWVEINGVRGEVLEIGLMRTILLETGNWTDPGHPTGRQVAFLNNYAVEGYYFNFSTAGQWMWDQLAVLIPAGRDPYSAVKAILALVKKETGDARHAGAEWQRAARHCGVRSFSAEPEITVKPTDANVQTDTGVELVVRYMTRANECYDVRNRLSHAIVKLLQPAKSLQGISAPPVEFGPSTPAGKDRLGESQSGVEPATVERRR